MQDFFRQLFYKITGGMQYASANKNAKSNSFQIESKDQNQINQSIELKGLKRR